MFTQQINSRTSLQTRPFPSFLRQVEYTSFDLQYEICSKYTKQATEQLYLKELQLIEDSSKIIQRLSDCLGQKDISSTQESTTIDNGLDDDDVFSQASRSKLLLRKSYSNTNLRRSDSGLGDALREVEKKCTEKTAKMLSSLSCEYRKLKERLSGLEKLEKQAKRTEMKLGTTQEELMVLRKRVSDLEKTGKTIEEESLALKRKLKEMSEETKLRKLTLSKSSGDLKAAAQQSPADKLKKYLEEKEIHIFKKEREIKSIQENIRISLEGCLREDGCEKCCQLMKRIKESIMKYRAYLQQQANVAQLFYNKYKHIFS